MYAVSDSFKEAVKKSHVTIVKVEVFDVSNGSIISTAQPISGSVSIDSRRSVRRECSLEFVDTDGTLVPQNNRSAIFLPYNREIKIYRGVVFPDGTEELVPLGVFVFIFPSYMMHRVTKITKGTRRSFVLWVGGDHYR